MESGTDIESQAPTFENDLDDRKSEKLEVENSRYKPLSEPPPENPEDLASIGDFPDGGFDAWFCIAGGFCNIFSSFGWVNCKRLSLNDS